MAWKIRDAEAGERGVLSDLHRRSSFVWEEDRANLEAHPDALGVELEAILDKRVRVAVGDDDVPLGFSISSGPNREERELVDLFVEPDFMRQGIGRLLVEDVASGAAAASCRCVTVVAHPRTFPFYEAVGFVPGEPVATRFGPAVKLRRSLQVE